MKSHDKRGPYVKLSSSQRCEIAKYADQHGAAETSRHFSRKLGKHVSESTVKSICNNKGIEVAVFNFRRWTRATKIKRDENLTDKINSPIYGIRVFPTFYVG